jgi:essential nuclear protein 1
MKVEMEEEEEEEEEVEGVDAEEVEMEEIELNADDERALEMFMPVSAAPRRTLADIIMEKLKEAEEKKNQAGSASSGAASASAAGSLDPKVKEVYMQIGKYLNSYTSGKIPKAFKVIPALKNWEEILHLTQPEKWSPQAMKAATHLFAANLNPKMAQRFYNLVLLPRVRADIQENKKLNFHLYESIRKTIYKPAAFFKGILLPLVDSGCNAKEAIIFSSILAKCSVPVLHASVALLKLTQMPYSGPCTLFMKTLLNKKYSLPYKVIDSMVDYFKTFINDERELPVVWHQNLLTFAQRYKNELSDSQKETIKMVSKVKSHKAISDEIRREIMTLSV